ncbi:hypothetical protein RBH26_14865 [Natronolimnohabitans sp. A-GB9]|uniref:hypothetical protein n=1 Tax=Natronolimnohabitans sp. A-GB9 TaxID=3069757 RepID=UPI0027B593F7|nr:hypothetical protein [Natronolimnohabitans sp. A-GB9]MDQ2051757.1 hypothetical protein [Natronolimnohabitans sp. A-GB9]
MGRATIRDGIRIARVEWLRHRRERNGRWSERLLVAALFAAAVVLGVGAFAAGRVVTTTPLANGIGLFASLLFVALVARSGSMTHDRFERLNETFLLTTVPTRAAAVGLVLFVGARVAARVALPTVSVAIGAALGLQAPVLAVTTMVAIAALGSLAVAVGVTGRLAARLVGMRIARARLLRDLFLMFAWLPLLIGWFVIREVSLSIVDLLTWVDVQPVAWFGDLAIVGVRSAGIGDPVRGLAAVGLLAAIPLLIGATTVLLRRIWETEPTDSSHRSVSRSLVGDGPLERLLAGRISRPMLTVARERFLLERRVPRGLLSTGYVLLFVGVILLPAFVFSGTAAFLLVPIVLGMAAGITFAIGPLEVEYRTLPMLLTTVSGRAVVGGLVTAALVVGVPAVTLVVLSLGLLGPVGAAETIAVVLVGVAVCACTAATTAAIDMAVDRDDVATVPFFFTSIPVYAETGARPFLRLAGTFAVVTLVSIPAMAGSTAAVYDHPTLRAVPTSAVRLGSLLVTVLLALVVATIAFRIAVRRYRAITLN